MPNSVLRYELDKVRYLDLESCLIPVLFSQNFAGALSFFSSALLVKPWICNNVFVEITTLFFCE